MNAESNVGAAPSINGHLIALGAERAIAIYERRGEWRVAEFREGRGELTYAGAWFRFHSEGLRFCHNGRAGLQLSTPLTPEMLEKIERLHDESEAGQERILAVPRAVGAVVGRYWINVISRLCRRAARISQTFG